MGTNSNLTPDPSDRQIPQSVRNILKDIHPDFIADMLPREIEWRKERWSKLIAEANRIFDDILVLEVFQNKRAADAGSSDAATEGGE